MANRQTRSLRKRGLSLKFHKGVNFMDDAGTRARANHPEFSLVEFESTKGTTVNSSFEAQGTNNKRTSAWKANAR